jgi:hypothetical protein
MHIGVSDLGSGDRRTDQAVQKSRRFLSSSPWPESPAFRAGEDVYAGFAGDITAILSALQSTTMR